MSIYTLLVLVIYCHHRAFVYCCSSKYFDVDTFNRYKGLSERILKFSKPQTFQYLKGEGSQFVISYNYAKKSPIWAYEEITAKNIPEDDILVEPSDITIDKDIEFDGFRPDLQDAISSKHTLLPLVPYQNHEKGKEKLLKHTNHVLVDMNSNQEETWNNLNQHIRTLALEVGTDANPVRVCTGVLYRSKEEALSQDKIRAGSADFYKIKALDPATVRGQRMDKMSYDIKAGFAMPNALYKAVTYVKSGRTFLSMFVLSLSHTNQGKKSVENYFWSSLRELERQAGTQLFELELDRDDNQYRNYIEEQCNRLTKIKEFSEAACDVTKEDRDKNKAVGSKRKADEELEGLSSKKQRFSGNKCQPLESEVYLTSAEHSLEQFGNFITNYNFKNLGPDWVIEHMNRGRYESTLKQSFQRPNFETTTAMCNPFMPTTNCYTNLNGFRPFDRGHMAPASYHKDTKEHFLQTMTMVNIAPQYDKFNKGQWEKLERHILQYFGNEKKYEEMYIMTGSIFRPIGNRMEYDLLSDCRIAVPTHFVKAIIFANEKESIYDEMIFELKNIQEEDRTLKNFEDFKQANRQDVEIAAGFQIFRDFRRVLTDAHEMRGSCSKND